MPRTTPTTPLPPSSRVIDLNLKWDYGNEAGRSERLKQAIHDQLGLEIVPSRERIELLVVEREG